MIDSPKRAKHRVAPKLQNGMTLNDLKTFIADTRHQEGVSWYLRDDSPLDDKGMTFTLLAFDATGNLVEKIPDIGEQTGRALQPDLIARISALRPQVGLNAGFLRNYRSPNGTTAKAHYEACRDRWLQSPPAGLLRAVGA